MPNTSATGGYIAPIGNPAPMSDTNLQNFIHDWLVGITGLAPNYVIPKWQPEQPNIPDVGVDWLAFGMISRITEGYPYIKHYNSSVQYPNGYDEMRRNETLMYRVSIYGPNADNSAMTLREGMFLPQNTEQLFLNNMMVVMNGELITLPELIKDKWMYRVDFTFTLRRQIILDYAIENLLTASGVIDTDYKENGGSYYSEPIAVHQ